MKTPLKTALISIIGLLLTHCGPRLDLLPGHEFKPQGIALIENTLAKDWYPKADFSKVHFYALKIEHARDFCETTPGICSFPGEDVVVLPLPYTNSVGYLNEDQNYCPYLMHELMHVLLDQKYGDSDGGHTRKEWMNDDSGNTWMLSRCMEVGAMPYNVAYKPTGKENQ